MQTPGEICYFLRGTANPISTPRESLRTQPARPNSLARRQTSGAKANSLNDAVDTDALTDCRRGVVLTVFRILRFRHDVYPFSFVARSGCVLQPWLDRADCLPG